MTANRAAAAVVLAAAFLAACSSGTSSSASTASTPAASPASIAAVLGCQVSGPSVDPQNAYDAAAYDSLSAKGDPASPCTVGKGTASDVITFASEAKETDWLHQNNIADSQRFASGYVGLVTGNLWVVTSSLGVIGLSDIAKRLAPLGGRESTSF